MGMFTRTLEVTPFGKLSCEGQSKVWEAEVSIPPIGGIFSLRIHGTKSGPTEAQTSAYSKVISSASKLKAQSALPAAKFLLESGIVPSEIKVNSENVWEFLTPCFIEVHESESYSAGEGEPGQIAISLGFEIPWEKEHLLQIGTIDGNFDEIYSE